MGLEGSMDLPICANYVSHGIGGLLQDVVDACVGRAQRRLELLAK